MVRSYRQSGRWPEHRFNEKGYRYLPWYMVSTKRATPPRLASGAMPLRLVYFMTGVLLQTHMPRIAMIYVCYHETSIPNADKTDTHHHVRAQINRVAFLLPTPTPGRRLSASACRRRTDGGLGAGITRFPAGNLAARI